MREIKFRAWVDNKYMVRVTEISWDNNYITHPNIYDKLPVKPRYLTKIENVELMQFTGLKDKNGTEIYEGDIVKLDTPESEFHKTRNRRIIFSQKYAAFYIDPCTCISCWPSVEVIGNIHTTPELLKAKE